MLDINPGDGSRMLTAFAATLIIFSIPSGLIATRIGRKPTILVGLVGMAAGLVVGFFLRQPTALLIVLAIMGAFWALVNINSPPMVYDLGGEEHICAFTGLYYLSSSAVAITGPILSGRQKLHDVVVVQCSVAILAMTRVRARQSLPTL